MLGKLSRSRAFGVCSHLFVQCTSSSRGTSGPTQRVRHDICQADSGKQIDSLMALLFSLAIHNALAKVKRELPPGNSCLRFWTMSTWCSQLKFELCSTP